MGARSLYWVTLIALCWLLGYSATGGVAPPEVKPPLTVQWIYSMGPGGRGTTAPVVESGQVYITYDGELRCLDAVTGAEQWKFAPKGVRVTTAPAVWEKTVIVGADDSSIYGLSISDGKQVWEQACAGPVGGDPIILDKLLMFAAQDMVYAMVPDGGAVKWICSLRSPVADGPVTDGSMLYFLCQDGTLQSVDAAEGRYRWTAILHTGPNAFPPVVADRRVIVAGGKTLVAVSRSGAVVWSREMPVGIGGRPTVVADTLYVPCVSGQGNPERPRYQAMDHLPPTEGEIYSLYARSGSADPSAVLRVIGAATAPPLLTGQLLYAGTGQALVYALDDSTGRVIWTYRCLSPDQGLSGATTYGIYAPIVSAGGSLYCLTGDGNLYCFSAGAPDSAGPVFGELKPEPGSALPGKKAVVVSFASADEGSGVEPDSVQATYDGQAMKVYYDVATGEGSFSIPSPKDGSHILKVSAKDYRGNSGSTEWSFLSDITIKPPAAERPAAGTARGRGGTQGAAAAGRGGGGAGGAGRGGGGRGGGGRGGGGRGGGGRGGGGRGGRMG